MPGLAGYTGALCLGLCLPSTHQGTAQRSPIEPVSPRSSPAPSKSFCGLSSQPESSFTVLILSTEKNPQGPGFIKCKSTLFTQTSQNNLASRVIREDRHPLGLPGTPLSVLELNSCSQLGSLPVSGQTPPLVWVLQRTYLALAPS